MKLLKEVLDFFALYRVVAQNRSLLWQFIVRNISVRYRGAMLGLVWSFIQPLMMLCVYTFVFNIVFQARWNVAVNSKGAFAIIMFCGMALFSVFSESVSLCCYTITGNTNLVKKVIFPLEILPLTQTVASFILGTVWFVLLFLGTIFIYGKLSFTMLLLPLVLIPLFLFSLGVGFFVASLAVYVRDTSYVVQVILQVLFFMTPIFYPVMAIPEAYRWPLQINPLTLLIEEARKVFLFGSLPDWGFLGIAFLISLLVLQLGYVWFCRTKKGFADVL